MGHVSSESAACAGPSPSSRLRRRLAPRLALGVVCLMVSALLTACGGEDGRVTLTFFQFKGEAAQYFRDLAAEFERFLREEHPDE